MSFSRYGKQTRNRKENRSEGVEDDAPLWPQALKALSGLWQNRSSVVESKPEYIENVRKAVKHLYGCKAAYVHTEPVHEKFKGQTVWKGEVEVFDLTGHPKAKRAYAWSHKDGPTDSEDRFVAVLEIPPVESAITAVRAAIVAETRRIRGN